jgi:hypothetical protein
MGHDQAICITSQEVLKSVAFFLMMLITDGTFHFEDGKLP